MKFALTLLIPCVIVLSACGGIAGPTATPLPTATSTPFSQPIISTETLTPSATPVTTTSPEPMGNGIGYYYFVPVNSSAPQGSVVVFRDTYILAPTQSNTPFSMDTAADLKTGLQAALNDPRNLWISDKLEVANLTFDAGQADVLLQGEYFGVGDVTLIAARMQILLTIFANPAVQSARVTYNGDTIGNWGVSISINAKPADYVFTREEIDSFIKENSYKAP